MIDKSKPDWLEMREELFKTYHVLIWKKRVHIRDPDEVFSLPEPIRFALLYGHLRSYHEEKDKQSE